MHVFKVVAFSGYCLDDEDLEDILCTKEALPEIWGGFVVVQNEMSETSF